MSILFGLVILFLFLPLGLRIVSLAFVLAIELVMCCVVGVVRGWHALTGTQP